MNDSMDDDAIERASDPLLPHRHAPLSDPEAISALVDGHLQGAAFAQTVAVVQGDARLRATWQAYHLVGDLLRQDEASRHRATGDLSARIAAKLAAEPMPSPFGPTSMAIAIEPVDAAARASAADPAAISSPLNATRLQTQAEAANDPVWRWRAVAGIAVAVAVGAVGWNLWSGAVVNPAAQAPVLAKAEPPQQQQMLRDPRLDELLAAHEQSAGISALQMPAGFLRNATFEGRGR